MCHCCGVVAVAVDVIAVAVAVAADIVVQKIWSCWLSNNIMLLVWDHNLVLLGLNFLSIKKKIDDIIKNFDNVV